MAEEVVHAAQMFLHLAVDEFIDLVHQAVEEIAVVRDHDDRAVVSLQGLLEDVLRADIHVVGRLVEGQEIVGLEHQAGHRQAGAFAAAEHGHLLVDVVALEEECREDVAQFGTDIPHRNPVERVIDRGLLVEDIFLILGVITDIDIVADLRLAREGFQFAHQHAHHRGLSFAVSAHEGHFLAALDDEIGPLQDRFLRIADDSVLHFEGDVAAARRRRELHVDGRQVLVVDLDALDALKLLDARLHLIALGRLVAEFLDEFFGLLDHPLLIGIGGLLLGDTLLAEFYVL